MNGAQVGLALYGTCDCNVFYIMHTFIADVTKHSGIVLLIELHSWRILSVYIVEYII